MKTNPYLLAPLALAAVLTSTMLPATGVAKDHWDTKEQVELKNHGKHSFTKEKIDIEQRHGSERIRVEDRTVVEKTKGSVTRETIRDRIELLKVRDPRHVRVHEYFETLVAGGYSPVLLDGWLDALYAGSIVAGMPNELVVEYFGAPVGQREVIFKGRPASEWDVRIAPNHTQRITVLDGRIVRVHG